MKAGSYRGTRDQDKVTRASLIIGLFNGFALLFNGPWPLAGPMLRPWPGDPRERWQRRALPVRPLRRRKLPGGTAA